MNGSNSVMFQNINQTNVGDTTYLTMDGIVKSCRIAPLLELPIDFKEWSKPICSYKLPSLVAPY